MDTPRTRFATTVDGQAIAYAVNGSGPYLVALPSPPDNHIELEWADPDRRAVLEQLGRYCSVVRFDGRGTGASDREATDFSLDARLRDLEAVLDQFGNPLVILLTGGHGSQLAIAYAAAHQDLVTKIVLVDPFTRGEQFMERDRLAMWRGMLQTDYEMFTGALGAEMFGWGREEGREFSEYFRRCANADAALGLYSAMLEVDLTEMLPAVEAPTLVIRSVEERMISPAMVREFAAAMPNARLETVSGRAAEGTSYEVARMVVDFLGGEWIDPERPIEAARPPVREPQQVGLRTLFFTDLVGHTEMMSQLGDELGRRVLREHERITREALAQHDGREVKTMGDGFMASFISAQKALECAITLQRTFTRLGERDGELAGLRLRVGLNAGEPIEEDDDLFGHSVIAAARVASHAQGSEVLVSDVVRQLVAGKGFLFADRGEVALKGFEEPIRVWELNWQ